MSKNEANISILERESYTNSLLQVCDLLAKGMLLLLVFHERKNTFKCESCGYSCFLKGTLNEHIISIHERNMNQNFISICEENKPFKCEFCGYS